MSKLSMNEKRQKENKDKLTVRDMFISFTIFGLLWGIMSIIYILKLSPQNNDYIDIPKITWIWLVFLPAYLTYYFWLLIAIVVPTFELSPFLLFGFIIFIGIIIAWLIAAVLYALIVILNHWTITKPHI